MKNLMLFSMWVVASTAAVAVAWAGVSVVDDQVVDPPSVVGIDLTTGDVALVDPEAGDGSGDDSTTTSEREAAGDSAAVVSSPTTTGSDRAVPPTTVSLSIGQPSSSNQTTQSTTASTQLGSAQSSITQATQPGSSHTSATSTIESNAASTTQAATTQAATTQTFSLVGGTTAISFSSSGVRVLWATPNPGFDVEIEPESSGLKVEFESDSHRSRLDAWWSGGPAHSIREEDDD